MTILYKCIHKSAKYSVITPIDNIVSTALFIHSCHSNQYWISFLWIRAESNFSSLSNSIHATNIILQSHQLIIKLHQLLCEPAKFLPSTQSYHYRWKQLITMCGNAGTLIKLPIFLQPLYILLECFPWSNYPVKNCYNDW